MFLQSLEYSFFRSIQPRRNGKISSRTTARRVQVYSKIQNCMHFLPNMRAYSEFRCSLIVFKIVLYFQWHLKKGSNFLASTYVPVQSVLQALQVLVERLATLILVESTGTRSRILVQKKCMNIKNCKWGSCSILAVNKWNTVILWCIFCFCTAAFWAVIYWTQKMPVCQTQKPWLDLVLPTHTS